MEPGTWDEAAATFDEAADHGLREPAVRDAWRALLAVSLPLAPARVVDLGCGTGSLSCLAAAAGHDVVGIDAAPAMLAAARAKAATAGVAVTFVLGDAATPPLATGSVDVVLVRHVLWALPDPAAAVARWVELLRPGGRLVLVEGRWGTGAGLAATEVAGMVRRCGREAEVTPLVDPALWGGVVDDERYLVVSRG